MKRNKPFGLKVAVGDLPFEKALRIFRKKVDNSGLLKDLRDKEHFTKPSEERKLAHKSAVKRWKKKMRIEKKKF